MRWITLLLVLPLWGFSQSAADVALRTENKFRSLQSLSADFEQIYYSVTISSPLKEKGKLYIQKPGLMKWKYEEPEEKIFLTRGNRFEFYIPEEKQLIRNSFQHESHESEILALLSGQRRFLENYVIEFSPFPSDNKKSYQIQLTPKEEKDYSSVLLEIDENTMFIQKAIFFDWAGNKTEFRFTRIKGNPRFPPDLFEIKVPPGVEIIEDIH